MYLCVSVHVIVCVSVCVCLSLCMCVCVCVCVCLCACVCVSVCLCVCVSVCVCVCAHQVHPECKLGERYCQLSLFLDHLSIQQVVIDPEADVFVGCDQLILRLVVGPVEDRDLEAVRSYL